MAKRRARLSDNDPLSSTDKVLAGLEQFSQPASQPVSHTTSQQVEKSGIRKATFQIDAAVLKQLDRFHLELQLELGKGDAPYKEVIVEEAIARFLEQTVENRSELMAALRQRQEMRK